MNQKENKCLEKQLKQNDRNRGLSMIKHFFPES